MEPTFLLMPLSPQAARMKNPLALAFLGDTVWDLLVRGTLLKSQAPAGTLHRRAVGLVNAAAQAEAMNRLERFLTPEEADIARRGRNAHAHHGPPRHQDPVDYSRATGLEALLGYLYLTGQTDRIRELFDIAVCIK